MPKKYRSDAFAAIHETMEALYEIGAVDKRTMCEFDETCLQARRSECARLVDYQDYRRNHADA